MRSAAFVTAATWLSLTHFHPTLARSDDPIGAERDTDDGT